MPSLSLSLLRPYWTAFVMSPQCLLLLSLFFRGVHPQSSASNFVVTSIAGNPRSGSGGYGDGIGSSAEFKNPSGIATFTFGSSSIGLTTYVFVCDANRIRRVSGASNVDVFAGSPTPGSTNDPTNPTSSTFSGVFGMAILPPSAYTSLTYFVTEGSGHRVRELKPSCGGLCIATGLVAGNGASAGIPGFANGVGPSALFNRPLGITVVVTGVSTVNLYVCDFNNNQIRGVLVSGTGNVVSTVAGDYRASGLADGTGSNARFKGPIGIAYYSPGYCLFVTDSGNGRIRSVRIAPPFTVTTIASASGAIPKDGVGSNAIFVVPQGIAIQGSSIFITDSNTIRSLTFPSSGEPTVSTIAGNPNIKTSIDGTGTDAGFKNPVSITVDSNGTLFVVDSGGATNLTRGGVVRKMVASAAGGTTPTTTPTPSPTRGSSFTPTPTPTATGTAKGAVGATPTPSPSPTPSGVATPTTLTPTPSPTSTDLQGVTPSTTPTPEPTPSPSPTPTGVASESVTPTVTPTSSTVPTFSSGGGGGGGGNTPPPSPTQSGTPTPTSSSLSSGVSTTTTPSGTQLAVAPNNSPNLNATPPLSPGSTAGIAIGSLVGVGAIGAGAAFFMGGRRSKGKLPVTSSSSAPAHSTEVIINPLGGNGNNGTVAPTSAPPAPTQDPLPQGWTEMSDDTDVWYVGPTGESVWVRPT